MSVNVSVRLDDRLAERLRLRASAAGETLSDRLRRYAEEGTRRDEHPMITFRDGPTGRRAGLIGGPDVWEVAMWIDDLGSIKDPAAELAADGVVSRPQIDAVLAYRAAYPDEIQARIELHRSETAAAERGEDPRRRNVSGHRRRNAQRRRNRGGYSRGSRLAGASDPDVFTAAVAGGYSVLTENAADFARIAASTAPPAANTTAC